MKKATYNYGLKLINNWFNGLKNDFSKSLFDILELNYWLEGKCTKTFINKFKSGAICLAELKVHAKKRYFAELEKERAEKTKFLDIMADAPEVKGVEIHVYWTKSRTWGSNPRAEIFVQEEGGYNRVESISIGGCGYDKRSAAIAQALNKSYSVRAALLDLARKESNKEGGKTYGYSNFNLPCFDGGVGFECHRNILEKIGLKAEVLNERSSNYDFYMFKKGGK